MPDEPMLPPLTPLWPPIVRRPSPPVTPASLRSLGAGSGPGSGSDLGCAGSSTWPVCLCAETGLRLPYAMVMGKVTMHCTARNGGLPASVSRQWSELGVGA